MLRKGNFIQWSKTCHTWTPHCTGVHGRKLGTSMFNVVFTLRGNDTGVKFSETPRFGMPIRCLFFNLICTFWSRSIDDIVQWIATPCFDPLTKSTPSPPSPESPKGFFFKTVHRRCDQDQVLCRNVHTGSRQEQGPGTIVSYCDSAIPCSSGTRSRAVWISHDWSWILSTNGWVSTQDMFCSFKTFFPVLFIYQKCMSTETKNMRAIL